MTVEKLTRWSGWAAVAGGITFVALMIFTQAMPDDEALSVAAQNRLWVPVWGLMMVAFVLLLLGITGIYAYQAEAAGPFGLGAFLVAFCGLALILGFSWAFTFVVPSLAEGAPAFLDDENIPGPLAIAFPITFSLFSGGLLLFGLATARANVLPLWGGIAVALGATVDFATSALGFNFPIGGILMGLGLAWLGYAIAAGAPRPSITPRVATS